MLQSITKLLAAAILLTMAIMFSAGVGFIFLYAGWNYGFVPATGGLFPGLGFGEAFWLAVFVVTMRSLIASDSLKKKE